jgi:hypothetical protein
MWPNFDPFQRPPLRHLFPHSWQSHLRNKQKHKPSPFATLQGQARLELPLLLGTYYFTFGSLWKRIVSRLLPFSSRTPLHHMHAQAVVSHPPPISIHATHLLSSSVPSKSAFWIHKGEGDWMDVGRSGGGALMGKVTPPNMGPWWWCGASGIMEWRKREREGER